MSAEVSLGEHRFAAARDQHDAGEIVRIDEGREIVVDGRRGGARNRAFGRGGWDRQQQERESQTGVHGVYSTNALGYICSVFREWRKSPRLGLGIAPLRG